MISSGLIVVAFTAKTFADNPFDPIAIDGARGGSLRLIAKPRRGCCKSLVHAVSVKARAADPFACREHIAELGGFQQPRRFLEPPL